MKKIINKIWRDEAGTALLTAMLIMGVLLAISIALSSLVMREVRVTKDLIDAGKAFYSAESGVEEALYFLNNNLPGWETGEDDDVGRSLAASGGKFKYIVKNQCNSYPCIDEGEYDVADADPEAFYQALDLNESVLIPLFVVENGEIKSVEDFTVEFYGEINPKEDLKFTKGLSSWDVIRWKVFGMKKDGNDYITESISDFMPLAQSADGMEFSTADQPAWFGTIACSEKDNAVDEDGNPVRTTSSIKCNPYDFKSYADSAKNCKASLEARDYYLSTGENIENEGCKPIEDFVLERQEDMVDMTGLNYLSLTNIINPAFFDEDVLNQDDVTKLYFRVETYGDKTVRETAEIVADGYAGNSKQSIKVLKRRDAYMPVFNFSVYSTYGSMGKEVDEEEEDVKYYLKENDPRLSLPQ
ncbi:MAG: pilus assembly PilX N-terminal domain-containing protein [Candidatus Gracilibacteria bacterium]|nr:pilus assembly PilX N-terminal domain-containing protein [Candidatus Gracilibacteria bacterium]